ncbi:hypothetical protein A6R68_02812, partial [Neotoma lepida]
LDDELDSFHNLKKWETKKELIEDDHRDGASKITKQSFREIEKDALLTNTTSPRLQTERCSDSVDSPLKHGISPKSKVPKKQNLLPHQISQIYDELFHIHLKLQCETASQQKFAEELQKREQFLAEREQLLFRHETALSKIKGVEEEVMTRFQILKELNEMSEENRKMEVQAKKVQARLDNLQTALNGQVYELLIVFMDWISDYHLNKVEPEEPGVDASAHDDRAAPVDATCERQTARAIYKVYILHSTMTSTLRRLGEDIFKGVAIKGTQDNSVEHSVENKPKTAAFFKSSNLSLRFLSTLIVLKTVT